MSIIKRDKYFLAKLTLTLKESPYTTKDIWVGNRHAAEGELYTSSKSVYPVLSSLSGFGQNVQEVLPSRRGGSITLDNVRGSITFDTRFSDLLEDYAILYQACTIYSFEKEQNVVGDVSDRSVEFIGIVTSANVDNASNTITLTLDSSDISTESPNYLTQSTDFISSELQRTTARYLPMVFGEAEVVALPRGEQADIVGWYMTGTSFSDFSVGDITDLKIKNKLGDYISVKTAASTTTKLFDNSLDGNEGSSATGTNIGADAAVKVSVTSSDNYALIGGVMYFYDTATGVSGAPPVVNGAMNWEIWKPGIYGQPAEIVGKATLDKESPTWGNAGSVKSIGFRFDEVVPIDGNWDHFFFRWAQNSQDGQGDHSPVESTTSSAMEYWTLDSQNNWAKYTDTSGTTYDVYFYFNGITYSHTGGSSYGSLRIDQTSTLYSENPDIGNLDMIATIEGFQDDGSGTITGVADSTIDRPDHVAKLLYYKWNGNSASGFDNATFDNANALSGIEINGAGEGRRNYRDLTAEILNNSACKLVPRRNGDLAVWPYGDKQDEAKVITEDDCNLLSYNTSNSSEIVNKVRISYDQRKEPLPEEDIQKGEENFAATLTLSNLSDDRSALFTTDSVSVYGTRELSPSSSTLPWVSDETTAKRWGENVLANWATERKYFTLSIPFWKNDYRTLELMDKVRISHVDSPSACGSTSANVAKLPGAIRTANAARTETANDEYLSIHRQVCAKFSKSNNEYLSLANASAGDFKFGDIDFCFFGWFYFDATGSGTTLFDMWAGSGNNRAYEISTAGSNINFYISSTGAGGGATSSVSVGFSTGWHFLYCYNDSANDEIGISLDNGTINTSSHSGGAYGSSTDNFEVCGNASAGGLNGRAQFVGCAHSVLTSDQLTTLYNSGNGMREDELSSSFKSDISLVSYWEMTNRYNFGRDFYGTNHLTDNNTIQVEDGLRVGSGIADPVNELLFGNEDFSFCGWFYFDDVSGSYNLIRLYSGSGDNRSYVLDTSATDLTWSLSSDGTAGTVTTATASAALSTGWNFVWCYHNAATDEIGVGVQGSTFGTASHSTGAYADTEADFFIAAIDGVSDFNGRVSNVGCFSTVLDSSDRSYLYNSGNGWAYEDLPASYKSDLVAWWNMDEESGNRADNHTSTYTLIDNNTVQKADSIYTTAQRAIDFALGHVWRRAKDYMMRIVDRIPVWNGRNTEPEIVLVLKVLDNKNEIS